MNLRLVYNSQLASLRSSSTRVTIRNSQLHISGSKSETNRLLLLQALYPNISLENISDSDDSEVMQTALQKAQLPTSNFQRINVHHAGTAMRFLTAYFAIQEGIDVTITGSSRMQQRPIKILVEALRQLGADIQYEKNEGFPPLRIRGKKITKHQISIKAEVSSQYISALLLIAPKLENGLELTLEGEITSAPYIQMTLDLLKEIGVSTSFEANQIKVNSKCTIQNTTFIIESDWSSASYFYSIVALSEIGTTITLSGFKQKSLQGDAVLVAIYQDFGVTTVFNDATSISITKTATPAVTVLTLNLNHAPDIAQTIAVTCLGLGIGCQLTGLHTLKIKETDRLVALKNEITKLGGAISVTHDSLTLSACTTLQSDCTIATYHDHRMAMAFAPLALRVPIIIEAAEVVSKSYPNFWNDLGLLGFQIENN